MLKSRCLQLSLTAKSPCPIYKNCPKHVRTMFHVVCFGLARQLPLQFFPYLKTVIISFHLAVKKTIKQKTTTFSSRSGMHTIPFSPIARLLCSKLP